MTKNHLESLYCEDCDEWTMPEVETGRPHLDDAAWCSVCGEYYDCGECGYDIDIEGNCLRPDGDIGVEGICPSKKETAR